ncbi:MAG: zf-HC2 domain-containing protein [Thermoguttaceae bacterium]
MKNQPNDELLSAYLDGELNDAERAEVERRLADDPAAARLLEQLRSVRRVVQSLPREPLGENLTQQVIEEAERRRGGSFRPMPPARSWSERFLNRRVIAWASLTLIVGAAIAIHERWQKGSFIGEKPVKEVARADGPESWNRKPANEKLERDDAFRPPAMQAAPRTPSSPSESTAMAGVRFEKLNAPAVRNVVAKAPDASRGSVLMIRCDVSSEAARSRAFDKLLISNGIVSLQRRASLAIQAQDRRLTEAKSVKADLAKVREEDAWGEEIIEVEATPSQIEATLAGLESRPDAFPFVAVGPVEATVAKRQASGASESPSKPMQSSQSFFGYGGATSRESQRLENQRQLQLNFQDQRLANASSQQRATFVLRMVGGHAVQQAESRPAELPAFSPTPSSVAPAPRR